MISLIVNFITAAAAIIAVCVHSYRYTLKEMLKYFTVLSNLFCALVSLSVGFFRLTGEVPQTVLLFKFIGTAAVSVTLLTVVFFLAPFCYGFRQMLSGPDLWLHLICPLTAILSCILLDKPDLSYPMALLGMSPVLLYGCFYLYKTVFAPKEKRWQDFYQFNRNGRWPASFFAMMILSFLISTALWAL